MSIYLGTNLISGTQDISGKANTDFDNITSTAKNIGNWSSNVTNCITDIPQDIKLELSSGTLTLKAGSKVYVPNGAGVFNTLTISSDITVSQSAYTDTYILFVAPNNTTHRQSISTTYSGASQPTVSGNYAVWYDTTNNSVKYTTDGGSTWTGGYSLPFAIVSSVANTSTNIDQVFNGFGYIGSTVFALPGVKGLIPNGRNTDGTLKNIEYSVSNVLTRTFTSGVAAHCYPIALQNNGFFDREYYYTLTQDNYLLGADGIIHQGFEVFKLTYDSNVKITSFIPKTVFHALDWNDKETIVGFGRPDYSSAISIGQSFKNSTYTVQNSGFYVLYLAKDTASVSKSIGVNGIPVCVVDISAAWQSCIVVIELSAGDVLSTASGVYDAKVRYYIPYKM